MIIITVMIFGVSILGVILFIGSKFSALAQLPELPPVVNLEQKRKDRIISARFQRIFRDRISRLAIKFQPIIIRIKHWLHISSKKIKEWENQSHDFSGTAEREKDQIQKLIWESTELVSQGRFDDAERKYIQVITWDHRNLDAYKGLADLYWRKKDFLHAREALKHCLKLAPKDPEIYWEMANINQAQDNLDGALQKLNSAFELAPNNPKYIDSLLELTIVLGRKDWAWRLVAKLKEVNPENQKLADLEDRIRKI